MKIPVHNSPVSGEGYGYVYIMSYPNSDKVKIGHSLSPVLRASQIGGTLAPEEPQIEVLFWCAERREAVERAAHQIAKNQRGNGEWFALSVAQAVSTVEQAAVDVQVTAIQVQVNTTQVLGHKQRSYNDYTDYQAKSVSSTKELQAASEAVGRLHDRLVAGVIAQLDPNDHEAFDYCIATPYYKDNRYKMAYLEANPEFAKEYLEAIDRWTKLEDVAQAAKEAEALADAQLAAWHAAKRRAEFEAQIAPFTAEANARLAEQQAVELEELSATPVARHLRNTRDTFFFGLVVFILIGVAKGIFNGHGLDFNSRFALVFGNVAILSFVWFLVFVVVWSLVPYKPSNKNQ